MTNKPRILVVDDSALARRTTRQTLEQLGYEVEEATDGVEALERYFLKPHDLVILDLVMHGMYGMDVLTKIRSLHADARVLIATADIQSSTAQQAREAGAAGVLNKPVGRAALAAATERVLAGGEAWT